MHILLTRPEPDGERTAATLRALGHDVLLAPLMRIDPVAATIDGPFAAVLMTSANAARAAAALPGFKALRRLPAFTVGDQSAEAARAAGFSNVVSAQGALDDLVRLVAAKVAPGARLLYLAGKDRSGDLAGDLGAQSFAVTTAEIYRAVTPNALPAEAAKALLAGRIDAVLHYSRRGAATLVRLAGAAGAFSALLGAAHYCLSEEVAAPLRDGGAKRIKTAPHPTEEALIHLL